MNHQFPVGMPSGAGQPVPSNRYILPQFEERTPYGFKRQDPYTKLFEDRIVFLGVQVDDAAAHEGAAVDRFHRDIDRGIEAEEEPAEGGNHRAEEDCFGSLHDPWGAGGGAWPGRDGRC